MPLHRVCKSITGAVRGVDDLNATLSLLSRKKKTPRELHDGATLARMSAICTDHSQGVRKSGLTFFLLDLDETWTGRTGPATLCCFWPCGRALAFLLREMSVFLELQ